MFEGKELRLAKKSAARKHELYIEMRQMYVSLSKAYVKIRKRVDALFSTCPEDRLMAAYIKLYLDRESVQELYSMPVLLGSGHILTLQDPWTDPVRKTNADIAVGIYIDNRPVYLWNYEDEHFKHRTEEQYFDVDTVQHQLLWDKFLDECSKEIESLRWQLQRTNPLRVLQRKDLAERLKNIKAGYETEKQKAAVWFQNGMTAEELGTAIFTRYGLRRKKCATEFSSKTHKMEVDALPIKRPAGLSEAEQIAYWKAYESRLDEEIQKIRSYIPAEDDVYIDYEACANGIEKTRVLEQCHNDVALYRFWLRASCVIYFKRLVEERDAYRQNQAEYRQKRAEFIANLASFGEYTVEDGVVFGPEGHELDSLADTMSRHCESINRRAVKSFNSDAKEINEQRERFGME